MALKKNKAKNIAAYNKARRRVFIASVDKLPT